MDNSSSTEMQVRDKDARTPDELVAECRSIAALLPGDKAEVSLVVLSGGGGLNLYPCGLTGSDSKHIDLTTSFAASFAEAREWCATYKDRRRADAERRLAEAQAAIAALDAEAIAAA